MTDKRTSDTTQRMRSCQLFIRRPYLSSRYFEIVVREMQTSQTETKSVVVDHFKTNKPHEVHAFMGKYGIPSAEVVTASRIMAINEHNAASFGFFGNFMFSFDDEVVQ